VPPSIRQLPTFRRGARTGRAFLIRNLFQTGNFVCAELVPANGRVRARIKSDFTSGQKKILSFQWEKSGRSPENFYKHSP